MDPYFFDNLAMDVYGHARALIATRIQLQVGFGEDARLVAAASANVGDAEIVLRAEGGQSIQGDLPRGVRVLRGGELVLVAKVKSGSRGDQIIVRGDVMLDLAEGDVLDLKAPEVVVVCYERAFDVDDKSNTRLDFRNLHLSRDEAKRQRINLTAEILSGDVRDIREGAIFRYEEDDFVYGGVVRSADRRGRRFVDLQVEVEDEA